MARIDTLLSKIRMRITSMLFNNAIFNLIQQFRDIKTKTKLLKRVAMIIYVTFVKANETTSQFHQCFTRTVFLQNFGAKNYKAVFWV